MNGCYRRLVVAGIVIAQSMICFGSIRRIQVAALISVSDAGQLVLMALEGRAIAKLPGFNLEFLDNHEFAPGFYLFEGHWNNRGEGSIVAGHYAVNRMTGDVWEYVACQRITSASLRRQQEVIRKKLRMTQDAFKKLSLKNPPC